MLGPYQDQNSLSGATQANSIQCKDQNRQIPCPTADPKQPFETLKIKSATDPDP